MSYKADIFQVIIASPGDVPRERQLAREIILEWNAINSRDKKIFLMPVGWEHNSTPEMGDRGQEFINKQILEESDLLIGIFWTRIGSQTGDYKSGSVEEIEKHVKTGKPTMLYFSNVPVVLDSTDPAQYEELKKFKEKCQSNGLVESFNTIEEFRMKLTRQLSSKIIQHNHFKGRTDLINNEIQDKGNNENEIINNLSDTEKLLLIEASKDPSGTILKLSYIGGIEFHTNTKLLNEDDSPRTKVLWDTALNNLINKGLIKEVGFKGEVFELTLLGYKIADLLL